MTIGAAIVKDSPVIYFDEPTSGLDYDSMVRVSHLIEQLAAAGVIIFVVSHDFEFITRTCSEVLQLDGQDSIKNQVLTPEILLSLSKQYFNLLEALLCSRKYLSMPGRTKRTYI